MLLTKFSNLRIVHTAGTNLPVADMLSRDFSSINSTSPQLKHKTLPPHIEFVQLNPNNTLEETHYLVQHEEVLPTQKNDSHPIVVDYSLKQYTLRIHDSGNDVTSTPLNSFSFKGLNTFNSKYKRPVKNTLKAYYKKTLF